MVSTRSICNSQTPPEKAVNFKYTALFLFSFWLKTIREREFIFKDVMGFNTCFLKFSTFFGLVSKYVTQKRLNHLLCSFLTKRIFTIDVNLHYKSRCRWIRPVDCCCVFTNFDLFLFSFLPKSRQESKFSSNQHRKS